MTIQELLKAQGLDDATITKVTNAMKENKIFTSSEENLDIRYGKLKTDSENQASQLKEAQKLIDEMKKSTTGNEDLQKKVTEYETQVANLSKQLSATKVASALKVALLSEKAKDIDYLTFKLKEGGEIELDDKEQIKGWSDKIASLKKQFPNQFEASSIKKIDPNKLNKDGKNDTLTRESILKMPYKDRAQLQQDNPEGYKEAMKVE